MQQCSLPKLHPVENVEEDDNFALDPCEEEGCLAASQALPEDIPVPPLQAPPQVPRGKDLGESSLELPSVPFSFSKERDAASVVSSKEKAPARPSSTSVGDVPTIPHKEVLRETSDNPVAVVEEDSDSSEDEFSPFIEVKKKKNKKWSGKRDKQDSDLNLNLQQLRSKWRRQGKAKEGSSGFFKAPRC